MEEEKEEEEEEKTGTVLDYFKQSNKNNAKAIQYETSSDEFNSSSKDQELYLSSSKISQIVQNPENRSSKVIDLSSSSSSIEVDDEIYSVDSSSSVEVLLGFVPPSPPPKA